jgi:hypothetical protein
MLDYMMWPWSERSKIPSALQDKEFQFPKEKFPKLVSILSRQQKIESSSDIQHFASVC